MYNPFGGLDFSGIGGTVSGFVDGISGKRGLDTAAQGARDAQSQANALSELQWQRQMQGLQEVRGQTQPYLSLYDQIYGTKMAGRQAPVGGLSMPGGGMPPPGAGSTGQPRTFGGNDAGPTPYNPNRPGFIPIRAPIMQGGPPAPGYTRQASAANPIDATGSLPVAYQPTPAPLSRPGVAPNGGQGLEALLRQLRGGR